MTAIPTTDRASSRSQNDDPDRLPTCFRAKCRTLADANEKIGTRLRIALSTESAAEAFLIHASYHIHSRMHVYGEAETEAAITRALDVSGSTCQEFLEEAADAGRRLAKPGLPPPVLWDEPTLVIAGIAPGTVAIWRRRRLEGTDRGGARA